MTITFNNQSNNGIYVFSEQPNILRFEGGDYPTTNPSKMFIDCPNNLDAGLVGEIIEVNGEQITSVATQQDAGVRQFAISSVGLTTANSICTALRSISSLLSNYDIYFGSRSNGGRVTLIARQTVGYQLTGSSTYQYIEITSIDSEDAGIARKASVNVAADSNYLTTLEKVICSPTTNFDVSPVIASVAEYDRIGQITLTPWTSDDILTVTTGRSFNCSVLKGYHTEGQPLFLTGSTVLQNVQGTLYIAANGRLEFGYLNTTSSEVACTVTTRDSAFNQIDSDNFDFEGEGIVDCSFDISGIMTDDTFYVDVDVDGTLIRYNVIRPSRLSEGTTRVSFRNSMGGVSFFDFTGKASKKNAISHELYRDEGSSYGYYDGGMRYDRLTRLEQNDIEHTLRSHIVKEDALHLFEDMARSGRVWIGNELIIVKDIAYNEQGNSTYIVQMTYNKSRID